MQARLEALGQFRPETLRQSLYYRAVMGGLLFAILFVAYLYTGQEWALRYGLLSLGFQIVIGIPLDLTRSRRRGR